MIGYEKLLAYIMQEQIKTIADFTNLGMSADRFKTDSVKVMLMFSHFLISESVVNELFSLALILRNCPYQLLFFPLLFQTVWLTFSFSQLSIITYHYHFYKSNNLY